MRLRDRDKDGLQDDLQFTKEAVMSIAYKLQDYIADRHLSWDPVMHQQSGTCLEAAQLAHIPPDRIAKAVVLKGHSGYVMAVIPANHHLDLEGLGDALADELTLVPECALARLFEDCLPGAVPPVGAAYGICTLWDESLGGWPDVYFEGGDHQTLVHMSGPEFEALMRKGAARLPARCH
jgi:Ala-tRNA(Pro) deacylase